MNEKTERTSKRIPVGQDGEKSAEANENIELLKLPYPGRGIVMGRIDGNHVVQVYWIMGRSENSRNRVLERDGNRVSTGAADPSKMQDPSLILYNAMDQIDEKQFVVTNGAQTDTVVTTLRMGSSFKNALRAWDYEPDAPIYTPRISGMISLNKRSLFAFASVRRGLDGKRVQEQVNYADVEPATGYCLTTYRGGNNETVPFDGKPYMVPISGTTAEQIAEGFWQILNEQNRIAIAVKTIDVQDGRSQVVTINKYQKIS